MSDKNIQAECRRNMIRACQQTAARHDAAGEHDQAAAQQAMADRLIRDHIRRSAS
ncbi:hypothetical protein [Embleya sp. NPDC059237]|uniref:hypothetical protein n=1 Tax=Embleya sp. NPDC059237 TaxID=3346784 RepID=UPI0036CE97CB